MHCQEFRNRHLAFVDNTLSEADLVGMQRHLAECESCSRFDTAVRRGLLVFRNLPLIEPSPEFYARLSAKLRQLHQTDARAPLYRGPGMGSFIAAATGVIAAGFLAAAAFNWNELPRDLTLDPVVASAPDIPPAPIVSHTFVSSASTGVPVWPAAMLAGQVPVHFVNAEFLGEP
jgi:hypothetical protein